MQLGEEVRVNALARRRSEGPAARIVALEPGQGLDVVVCIERTSRRKKQLWVRVEVVDPVDEVLTSHAIEVPAPKKSLVQRVRVRCDLRALSDHESWGAMLDLGESVHMRWRVEIVDRLGKLVAEDLLEHELYAD